MNFLAHAYLSFEEPELMVGNFIADFIKGSQYLNYPRAIAQGILLHREIDHFTDQHPRVITSKRRLQPRYRHYAGVVVDMYFDHFLAANFPLFHASPLPEFTEQVYGVMKDHQEILPPKVLHLLTYMSRGNWLLSYADITGVEQALAGMSRRTKFKSHMEHAGEELRTHYDEFMDDFMAFFPEIIEFAKTKIDAL